MWELDCKEGWELKNWCFWSVVLEKTLESPLDCKEINQSILKEISPEYSLEGLMLKLKLQYFGHLMQKADWFEKTLMLGKIEGGRRRGWQSMRWLDNITDSVESESCSVESDSLLPMDCIVHGLIWSSDQNTGVGSLSLLQGIFPTQGLNPGFPHFR